MKKSSFCQIACLVCATFLQGELQAQESKPVSWQFSSMQVSSEELKLVFTATISPGWHLYSQFIEEGGPLATTFSFVKSSDYSTVVKVKEESVPEKAYDHTFLMDISWFVNTAVFSQNIRVMVPATVIEGTIEYMACTKDMCLPPQTIKFRFDVKNDKAVPKEARKPEASGRRKD